MAVTAVKNGRHGKKMYAGKVLITHPASHKTDRQHENHLVMLSPHELEQVDVFRASAGGYQRELSEKRAMSIAADLKTKDKSDYPPIIIANIKGKHQCVDGQHRLRGHILAKKNCPAYVRNMTLQEAIVLFVRDNGTAKQLRRSDIVAGANTPLCMFIRNTAAGYKANQAQITALVIGVLNKYSLPVHLTSELGEREKRAVNTILKLWTADKRYTMRMIKDIKGEGSGKLQKKFAKSTERAFSAVTTFWVLGKLGFDNLTNLTLLERDVRLMRDADWETSNLGSLRKIAAETNNQSRKKLMEVVQRTALIPGYKKR